MGTPRKNIGQTLESPYARHMQQYPSQSEGYVPNDFGARSWGPSSTPSKQQNQQSNNYNNNANYSRRGGGNRYFNVNRGPGSARNNGGGVGYRNNYQSNFQNNYFHQQQTHRQGNSGNRSQPYQGQRFNKFEGQPRDEYYHPSMLSDPWKELLDRHNAIKSSQITTPASSSTPEDDPVSSPGYDSPTQEDATNTAIPATTSKPSTNISP